MTSCHLEAAVTSRGRPIKFIPKLTELACAELARRAARGLNDIAGFSMAGSAAFGATISVEPAISARPAAPSCAVQHHKFNCGGWERVVNDVTRYESSERALKVPVSISREKIDLPQIIPFKTRASYAAEIVRAWQHSVDSIITVGRLIAEAKAELRHGEFSAMIRADLPFGPGG